VVWPLGEEWNEQRVEQALFGERQVVKRLPEQVLPDFPALHSQLQQHRHLTLQLAWEEYRQIHPEGYGYSRFCELYQRWRRKQDVVLRQVHKPGEKGFVDWAGTTIPVHDPVTGEIWPASLFVMVLGTSSYTYAEATRDEQLAVWINAHIHAFEYFSGWDRARARQPGRWRVTVLAPSVCEAGSQFHQGCVSRGPPIMPDVRIPQVRFEALAFRP